MIIIGYRVDIINKPLGQRRYVRVFETGSAGHFCVARVHNALFMRLISLVAQVGKNKRFSF